MESAAIPFVHREDSVAARIGCSQKFIRTHRTTQNLGRFWNFGPNRSFLWSDTGVEFLVAELAKNAAPASPDGAGEAEKPAGVSGHSTAPLALLPEKSGAIETLVATRTKFSNTRVLQARTSWGTEVTVIGVTSKLWFPGMLLLAREQSRGVWEFEGNPLKPEAGRRQPRGIRDNAWPRKSLGGEPGSRA